MSRPKKENALTNAQRQANWRAREKQKNLNDLSAIVAAMTQRNLEKNRNENLQERKCNTY